MANTHNQFIRFEQAISLSPGKKNKLIASRTALQQKITKYFKEHPSLPTPKFYIQGSYKMRTLVVKKDGTYDVDLGVYFLSKPLLEPQTLQKHIYRAVENHTFWGAEHHDKCIRVIYSGDFDIDLPTYYKTQTDTHPFLATKKNWQKSDPKEVCDWFLKKSKMGPQNGQLIRIIKYLKAWAYQRSKKMPSGIALTVWAAQNYTHSQRDDVAFYMTVFAIRQSLQKHISCINPCTPGDDLLAKLTPAQKNNFIIAIDSLLQDSYTAIEQKDINKSTNLWKQLMGNKFPNP